MKVGVSNMGFWWWVLWELELWGNSRLEIGNKLEEGGNINLMLCAFSGFGVPPLFLSTS